MISIIPPSDLSRSDSAKRLALALFRQDNIPIEKIEDRYAIRYGRPKGVIAELPKSLTEAFDNEYDAGASWSVVRLFPNVRGHIQVRLKRVLPRHGFVSTYQNEGCRCPDCTAANTEATRSWRQRVHPPVEKGPRKHGSGCWRYNCHCEARREADRIRQQLRRERAKSKVQ